MDMKPAEYFIGLTKSENLNLIAHMPDLTKQEYFLLLNEAEKRPESRYPINRRTVEEGYPTSYTSYKSRMQQLKEYLQLNQLVTRADIVEAFGLKRNGTVDHLIAQAKKQGIIEKVGYYNYRYKGE